MPSLHTIHNKSLHYFHMIHNPTERKDKRGIALTVAAVISCFTVLIPAAFAFVYGISSLIGRIKRKPSMENPGSMSLYSSSSHSSSIASDQEGPSPMVEVAIYDIRWKTPELKAKFLEALATKYTPSISIEKAAYYLKHTQGAYDEITAFAPLDPEGWRIFLMAFSPHTELLPNTEHFKKTLNQQRDSFLGCGLVDGKEYFDFSIEFIRPIIKKLAKEILSHPEINPFSLTHRGNFNRTVLRFSRDIELIQLAFRDLHTCGYNIENQHEDFVKIVQKILKDELIENSVFLHAFLSSHELPSYPRIHEYRMELLKSMDKESLKELADNIPFLNLPKESIEAIEKEFDLLNNLPDLVEPGEIEEKI